MRSETEVLKQLLDFARDHEAIRVVVMNGSRLNPDIEKDLFSDYDIVYYTNNPFSFLENQRWISYFGDLVMMQANRFSIFDIERCIFLMQFRDGVRIDLSFAPLASLEHVAEDTLAAVLLDKDQGLPTLPTPSASVYYPVKPSQQEFAETVNEILWCSGNVAKGNWRAELPYVKGMFDVVIRDALLKLIIWYAASLHGWAVNLGSYGRWLERYLPTDIWQSYVKTYAGVRFEEIWSALFESLKLTRKIGVSLANNLGYTYPYKDHDGMVMHLKRVRKKPPDAVTFE